MVYDNPEKSTLFDPEASATLRLAAFLLLGVVLMVADHRGGYIERVRAAFSVLAHPLYVVASAPARGVRWLSEGFSERQSLVARNREMAQSLLLAEARLNRLEAVQEQNLRLRQLLGAKRTLGLKVQFAELIELDLDPYRQRIAIALGSRNGVFPGQAVIDAHGVMGQVASVGPLTSQVILITDPRHAVPIQIQRSGLRGIAYGSGRSDRLSLSNIPISADIEIGDRLFTSGLGGVFPAGLPVGRVVEISSDESGNFVVAQAQVDARIERSGDVLLLWDEPAVLDAEPETSAQAAPEDG